MTSFDEVLYLCTYERALHHIAQYISGRLADCGCVRVWSGKGLWVCTCVEWQEIVGVYMCQLSENKKIGYYLQGDSQHLGARTPTHLHTRTIQCTCRQLKTELAVLKNGVHFANT